jgi:hypothetical protein
MTPPVATGGGWRLDLSHRSICLIAHQGGAIVVSKITWRKAGSISEPGRYLFTFGWLTVTPEDLVVWKQFPDAAFTLVELPARDRDDEFHPDEFHLGAFELPMRPAGER